MLTKFLQNFPPPKYLNVPCASVAFSDNSIRLLMLDKNSKHPTFFSEISLPPGIIETGKVKNEEALSKILKEARANLKTPFVKFCISDEVTYVFSVKIPVIPGKDAKEGVNSILEENVPLALSDIAFDFEIQKVEASETGYFATVVVMACSTTTIVAYKNALEKADFEPLVCVNESQSSASALLSNNEPSVSIIAYIHKNSVGIYIASGHLVEFSSVISIPSSSTLEMTSELIGAELEKAIQYWLDKKQKIQKKVDENSPLSCYLCGEYELVESFAKQAFKIPNIKILSANVWRNVFSLDDFVPEIDFEDSLRFASVVGLCLES